MFFYTERLLSAHTRVRFSRDVFKRTCSYTEILLHRDALRQRCLHTQKRLHIYTHTHAHFYTEMALHWATLHTEPITKKQVCWCFLLRNGFTRRVFYTDVFAQACFCMNSGERVDPAQAHIAISCQFLAIDISCEGAAFRGHQSTLPCRPRRKSRKTFEVVGVFGSWSPPASLHLLLVYQLLGVLHFTSAAVIYQLLVFLKLISACAYVSAAMHQHMLMW